MLRVIPTLCLHLSLHDYIVWPDAQEWWLFHVVHQWSDGVLLRCDAPTSPREHFLPVTQWVARVDMPAPKDVEAATLSPLTDILQTTAQSWHNSFLPVRLQGPSMGSIVPDGSELSVVPVESSSLAKGQILVMAGQKPIWVAHRVQSIERDSWGVVHLITKGDALHHCDVPITMERVFGRVSCVSHQGHSWDPEAWSTRCLSTLRNHGALWSRRIQRNLPFSKESSFRN